ncbi:MAG: DUF2188 domain-containing protein [Halobacteriaceae archaeon]
MTHQHYTVQKVPGGNRWEVLSDGHRVSKHNSKSNAVQKARDLMDRNDTGTVKKANGRFQKRL